MVSRRSAIQIAEAYRIRFSRSSSAHSSSAVYDESLYDFLYAHDYPAWFCNAVKPIRSPRALKEWFMKIHTGETLAQATPNWDWERREKLGQEYLVNLAETFLQWYHGETDTFYRRQYETVAGVVQKALELDGYVFRDGSLFQSEGDVLDVDQESGILHKLYASLGLARKEEAFRFLELSEEHFMDSKWGDCIANSRKFLELVLQQATGTHSARVHGKQMDEGFLSRPVNVRGYLEKEGILERKEREAIDKVYGLLSHTGGHPYMAESDQARLLRQLALTMSQFVLLRTEGRLRP